MTVSGGARVAFVGRGLGEGTAVALSGVGVVVRSGLGGVGLGPRACPACGLGWPLVPPAVG